jgi:hypothetical protein
MIEDALADCQNGVVQVRVQGFDLVELLVGDLRVGVHLTLTLPSIPAHGGRGCGLGEELPQSGVLVVFELALAHDNGWLEEDRTVRVLAHEEHLVAVSG